MNEDRDKQMLESIEESGLAIVDELKQCRQTTMELTVIDESGVWVVTAKRHGIVGDGFRPRS